MKIKNEEELRNLLIHSMKELGEIAEVLVKQDRPYHWKNELGDLCGLCILPMLRLADMSFDSACEIDRSRKREKTEKRIVHRDREYL